MSTGKNKAPLLLMEQLIMVLVFALTATFCIQAFVTAGKLSKESCNRDEAVNYAQTTAEVLKAGSGELEELKALFGGTIEENRWSTVTDTGYTIEVEKEAKKYLGKATILVNSQEDVLLYELKTAWQEVARYE